METECLARQQANLGVDGLDQGVREADLEGGFDLRPVTADRLGHGDEGGDSAAPRPLKPIMEDLLSELAFVLEDLPKLFLEQVGAEERLIGPHDVGQLDPLEAGEILRVLPQREAGAFEV